MYSTGGPCCYFAHTAFGGTPGVGKLVWDCTPCASTSPGSSFTATMAVLIKVVEATDNRIIWPTG